MVSEYMKVAVVGAGAMGCVYGGLLTEGGHEVWLIDIWAEHVQALRRDGLFIMDRLGQRRNIQVRCAQGPEEVPIADLVLVFVKAMQTKAAAQTAVAMMTEADTVVTLQNGVGNAEILGEICGAKRVVAGVSFAGARMLGPGVVLHSGEGNTIVGDLVPGTGRAAVVARMFTEAGITCQVTDDLPSILWGKLMVNIGANAVAALTGMTCGEMVSHPSAWTVMEELVHEAAGVAAKRNIELPYPDPVVRLRQAMNNLPSAKASMLQDIEAGRPTEIQAINGAVTRLAEEMGIHTPYNRCVTLLVQALETKRQSGNHE